MIRELFSKIPANAKVCIWGAANAGLSLKEEILKHRKDIKIIAFIDLYKEGIVDGIKIYRPAEILCIKDLFDFLLISTRSDCTVIDAFLFYYDIKNFVRISPELLKTYQFIPSKVEKVLSILNSEEDRILYRDLIDARITGNTDKVRQYVFEKHNITLDRKRTIKHYTSHINYDSIETVIEGGMFNGLNTIIFKKLFKNLKKIYAFELLYEKVKNNTISHIIESLKELEIVNYAMWNKKDKLEFIENVSKPFSSGVNPKWNRNDSEKCFMVDAISIDEFIEEKGIEKVDFIKMDIEGAELPALEGAINCLIKHRPQLAISIYHSNDDMQNIPIFLAEKLEKYIFKLEQYSPDNDETILYAIPEELYNV